jgi:hypothetical protein
MWFLEPAECVTYPWNGTTQQHLETDFQSTDLLVGKYSMVSLTATKWYARQALRLQPSMNCKKMHLVFTEDNNFCSNQMYTLQKHKNGNLPRTLEKS